MTDHEVNMAAEAAYERAWGVLHPDGHRASMVPFDLLEDPTLVDQWQALVIATFPTE